jgi:hypothetical protein
MKIPRSFKISQTVDRLLGQLAEIPEFGNRTRVLEVLVWREAEARCLVQPCNHKSDPQSKPPRKKR